ncbi:ATP-binding protein [Flagellimonas sp. CMM7]|uniref:ATP-binding protein n=1 Tax=Flagellimonas sp. CMM7 TaxID=2654676 RepID=UPI0013D1EC8F|nr:ATP-binding protein [Flagellimonas sp. CMM7]UII78588.1 ATP-binding protein [Flagellimonas sp. CMM7]
MQLAAIHIDDHFLFGQSQTINFGANYIYQVLTGGDIVDIIRFENKEYIKGFFDSTGILQNISAIVGANGSGKTSLLIEIVELLNSRYRSGVIIFEKGHKTILHRIGTDLEINPIDFHIDLEQVDINTIYYSPFLDFKNQIDGIDLSYDSTIKRDLSYIDRKYEANEAIVPYYRLKRANDSRLLSFIRSEFSNGVQKLFDLPQDNRYRIAITRYRINADEEGVNFHNTPRDFQHYLNLLYLKIRKEYDKTERNLSSEKSSHETHKALMKNHVLMDFFCLLVRLMEQSNTFLGEGHFEGLKSELEEEIIKDYSALKMFKYWLNNNYYSRYGPKYKLPSKEVNELLDFLYEHIDSSKYNPEKTNLDWSQKSLIFPSKKLDQLIILNEKLLGALPRYYLKVGEDEGYEYRPLDDMREFINVEYSNRKLSSGETAMLNVFSRIFDYFNRNLIAASLEKKYESYLLLLDEADMGFHPRWKRLFVKALSSFSIDFFKKLAVKVQIVFTSHDALSLSDIPNNNITYLKPKDKLEIINSFDLDRPTTSFAGNIIELLSDSFYLDDYLIGDFAKQKIDGIIEWINNNKENKEYNRERFMEVKKMISIIEEPVLRNKLVEMLSDIKSEPDFIQEMIDKETKNLRRILRRNQ